ncbi:MAG: sigma-54 dependent transcriptional regulator [Candidatus Latescibacterota bacterium]|jgi:DNA-binding NtrC family response regulator
MPRKSRILLLTQDARQEEAVRTSLADAPAQLIALPEPSTVRALLGRGLDLVILDLTLPPLLAQAAAATLAENQETPVLVLDDGAPDRWRALSRGEPLEQVLTGPCAPEELRRKVEHLLERAAFLRGDVLVGRSPAMRQLRERVLLIAPTPVATVLVTGESGVGKDLVAQALHRFSERRAQPFRAINCAAIPENLLESELFGHERGAFTDAKVQRPGIFEQANGGTVFLDEIGEMSLMAQVRLLRVLEQREVTRVGGNGAFPVDLRVIASTNKDLQAAVSHREFRLDLYHRLKVVELPVAPLRLRPEDLPLLVAHFVAQFSADGGRPFEGFSEAAMAVMMEYEWPGNVRELRNLVEHLVFLGPRRRLEPRDLLPHLERPPLVERHLPAVTGRSPDQSERELVYFALLDLKREVAELRHLVEERLSRSLAAPPTPVYQLPVVPVEADLAERPEEPAAVEPVRTLKELEKEAMEAALGRVGGNRKQAAQLLGISTRTLYRKLDEYGLR